MIRPELHNIPHDYHGAIDFAELATLGIAPDDVVDFSVNSNPFGPVEAVREAVACARLSRYPDKACLALKNALSRHLGITMEQIMVGSGSAELLFNIAFATLRPDDPVLILGPTFGEYARNARLMGAKVTVWKAQPEQDFLIETDGFERLMERTRPRITHICNPNNPTGRSLPAGTILDWAGRYPDTLFVIDEAYIEFAENQDLRLPLDKLPSNIVVLRSMTKDYALAGLRLGYAVADPSLIAGLSKVKVPWSVSELAQVAGVAALEAHDLYRAQWRLLQDEAKRFRSILKTLGFGQQWWPATHYFLLKVGDGRAFRSQLLQHGLLVRLCESYGLPDYVRISTQLPEQNARLLTAVGGLYA